jgi:predicted membrane protein
MVPLGYCPLHLVHKIANVMSNERRMSQSLWVGAIVLAVGSFLLLDKMDLFEFPHWLFSWKVMLVVFGVVIGIRKRFEGVGWLIMILLGSFFLVDDIPGFPYDIDRYAFPIGIIIVGLFIVFRALTGTTRESRKKDWADGLVTNDAGGEDYFDLTTVFGGTKKKVFSKKFRGGETTCIFGGADIDLSQADIEGTVVIDVVQLFGGVKLIIPSNWELKSDMTVVLGGMDDKRNVSTQGLTPEKRIVLTGFVMFGGVDVKSY